MHFRCYNIIFLVKYLQNLDGIGNHRQDPFNCYSPQTLHTPTLWISSVWYSVSMATSKTVLHKFFFKKGKGSLFVNKATFTYYWKTLSKWWQLKKWSTHTQYKIKDHIIDLLVLLYFLLLHMVNEKKKTPQLSKSLTTLHN